MEVPTGRIASDTGGVALRLENCLACGYNLSGLPPAGTCPECGGHFKPGPIVLHGSAIGLRRAVANATTLLAASVSVLIAPHLLGLLAPGAFRPHVTALLTFVMWVGWLAIPWRRALRRVVRSRVAVRLTPHGCLQLDGTEDRVKPVVTPWAAVTRVSVAPHEGGEAPPDDPRPPIPLPPDARRRLVRVPAGVRRGTAGATRTLARGSPVSLAGPAFAPEYRRVATPSRRLTRSPSAARPRTGRRPSVRA